VHLHYLGKQKTENCVFPLNAECCLLCEQTHETHSYYHLVTAEPPFIRTSIGRMHQTKPGKRVQHAAVCYHTLIVYQVRHDVGRCVKSGSCFCSAWSEKSMDSILTIWTNISCYQNYVVVDNIICILATHQLCSCIVRATQFNSCCAKLNVISLELYGPYRPELNQYYKIQGVYSNVNMGWNSPKLKKSYIDWSNSRLSSNNNIWVKRCDFCVSVFCEVVWKHNFGEVKNKS